MRKHLHLLGLTLLVAAQTAFAGNHFQSKLQSLKNKAVPMAVLGSNAQAKIEGLSTRAKLAPAQALQKASVEAVQSQAYGFLIGPDNKDWYYTMDFQINENSYYDGADVKVYDSSNELRGTFSVKVPEGKQVNQIEPFGFITKKFFDRDDKSLEVMVNLHVLGTPDQYYMNDSYVTSIYRIGGEKVMDYPYFALMVSASLNSYETYQRLIFSHTEQGKTLLDVYAPAGYGQTEPQLDHTFTLDAGLLEYMEGSYLNFYIVDHKPYFVLSHYEKPWADGYDPATYEPIVTPDNHFVLETYDKNYKRVDSLAFDLVPPEGRLYRFGAYGAFSDKDLTKNYFDESGNLAYVITYLDYDIATDDYIYNFYVADNKGNITKTLCENVSSAWGTLKSMPQFSDQMYFMQVLGDVQQIQTVDIPACEKATLFPAQINGERISTNFDRYLVGDDYQYVMSMGSATSDAEGNVIARLGWYTRDLELDHFTSFNLGKKGELFRPLLRADVLDPYLFDTDNDLDFIYLAKIKKEDSEKIEDVLIVANEDGTPIYSFRGDDEKGALRTASVLTEDANRPQLMLICYNYNTKKYTIEFETLPFNQFAKGGDGSKAHPYQIATVGDMKQMARQPQAYYELANDIDMGLSADYWTPLSSFTGHLDGKNHLVKGLTINSAAPQVGFFGTMGEGAVVKNLKFISPRLYLSSTTSNAGVIAGQTVRDTLQNIHIYDARIEGYESNATIGGLVGYGSVFTEIQDCSVQGSSIVGTMASSIGGIVGDARTNTNVTACAVTGYADAPTFLEGDTNVGGIMGISGMDAKVTDCHAYIHITATNTAGGIVGSNNSRAALTRNVAEGTVSVKKAAKWGKLSAGGILGYIESDWTQKSRDVVTNCVSAVKLLSVADNDGTVNRIVGFTIADENYEPGEKHLTELALANNYATETATVNGEAVASDIATAPNGATISDPNKEFFTSLAFAYGSETAAPWKEGETLLPQLYFENVVASMHCEQELLQAVVGEPQYNKVYVYGGDPSAIEISSSDESVATARLLSVASQGALLQVDCLKEGFATIVVKLGEIMAAFDVMAVTTGIHEVATAGNNSQLQIRDLGGSLQASGAVSMSVYQLNGQLVGSSLGDAVSVAHLAKGTYLIVATRQDGTRQVLKLQR